MPAWRGGPCPTCGHDIPAKVIHCHFCRALLNSDLVEAEVVVPEYFELQEISPVIAASVIGYHVLCPHCERELRINKKYAGCPVACKFCSGQFKLDITNPRLQTKAFYLDCPHCEKELRVAPKYLGAKVACKLCGGHVQIVSGNDAT
jgi:hypothetical protein